MKKTLHLVILLLLVCACLFTACGKDDETTAPPEESTVTTTAPNTPSTTPPPTGSTDPDEYKILTGDIALNGSIVLSADSDEEFAPVLRALTDLQKDFKAVTGKEPVIDSSATGNVTVLVGTLGHSKTVDSLVSSGMLDVSAIKDRWEAFTMGVYRGINGEDITIVIAGADKRGTVYGIYTLSELIGVSPWYWWADVPVKTDKNLSLSAESLTVTEYPDVKYRGIFLNDEENFTFWSEAFENATTSPGSPNPETYKKVFELILRLKANTLWPAMHNLSDAFNKEINPDTGIAYNAELADQYGVVMGSSHCELMLCNNETEWVPWCERNVGKYNLKKIGNSWKNSYDYTVNAEAMNAYWEERVATNYRFDNIYTIGLRGVHDSEILCSALSDKSWASKATVVQSAVEAQLEILRKYEAIRSEELGYEVTFPTCYAVYKEAAEYYKYDLSLPESCIILFCDDNYGYVRQMPNEEELETYEGFGVYYHVSYYGVPRSYLWIDTMPLSNIYAEMDKAFRAGEDDLWILNVGDLKPAEISINFFMDLAWDEDSITRDSLDEYLAAYFKETFTLSDADALTLAKTLNEYNQLAFAYKPEYQGYGEGTEYSLIYVGDEAERMIIRMSEILSYSAALCEKLPANERTSYQEIVHYKFIATLLTLQKNIYEQKNALYLSQGRFASVNAYAMLSEAAHKAVLQSVQDYCSLADGKWTGIMNPYQTAQGLPVIAGAPTVTYLPEDVAEDGVGAAVEGQPGNAPVDLYFDSLTDDARFIDIFSLGMKAYDYTITLSEGVLLSDHTGKALPLTNGVYSGSVKIEERFYLSIDWSKITKEDSTATVTVKDSHNHTVSYTLHLHKSVLSPEDDVKEGIKGHYESNGILSIEAEHYSSKGDVEGMTWVEVPYLGYTGSAMKTLPDITAESVRIDGSYETASPYLEYTFYVTKTGTYNGTFYRIPTLNEGTGRTNRTAYAFDGGETNLFRGNSYVDTNGSSTWSNSIRTNMEKMSFTVTFADEGWHTLRIYRADAGITFDKIIMIHSSVKSISRLGESESYNTLSDYQKRERTYLPDLSELDIKFGEAEGTNLNYDLTTKVENTQEGYTAVDLASAGVKTKRYEWTKGFETLSAYYRSKSKTPARDLGFITSTSEANFRITLAKTGKYTVTLAIGDPQSSGVSVRGMTVTANGKTVIEAFDHTAGTTIEKCFVIELSDTTLDLTFGGTWAVSAIEIRPYTSPVTEPTGEAITPDANGNIIIEAEWALDNSAFATHKATNDGKNYFMETGGVYGTAVYYGPNRESSNTNTSTAANIAFKVQANASGTYNVFALVKCEDDDDDSLIVKLDSGSEQTANDFKHTKAEYVWKKVGTVTLTEGKVSTLTVFGREDGLSIDRIVLTKNASWS